MKAKITQVTPGTYANGTKTLYHVIVEGGKEYTCFSKRIADMVGKEVEFEEKENDYQGKKQYTMNLPKEDGGRGFFTGGGGKSYGDPVMTAKTMLMAYAKDIVVAEIMHANKEPKGVIKDLMDYYDAMAKKIIPVQTPPAPAPEQKPVDTLSAAKQAIIHQKCKLLNFKAKDLIDFAGAIGLEIKYNAQDDTALIGQLDDQSAQHLINSLQDAAR